MNPLKLLCLVPMTLIVCSADARAQAPETKDEHESPWLDDYTMMNDKEVGYGADATFLEWHGYLNFEYDKKQGKNSNFDNHEFYLSATSRVSKRLHVVAEFEYEHTPEKLICPIQAYGSYELVPGHVAIRGGLFYIPIGLPRTYTLRGNKNMLIRQVALTHDIMFENWSEMGVELVAAFDLTDKIEFGLDVSVGNGLAGSLATGDSWFDADETLQSHSEDINNNKNIAGRAQLAVNGMAGVSAAVGGSFSTQKYDVGKKLQYVAADLRVDTDIGFVLQAEWMKRTGDDNDVDMQKNISANAQGWYVRAGWTLLRELNEFVYYVMPVFQADVIDLNTDTDDAGDKLTYSLGLVYSPEPHFLVKLEYDIVTEMHGEAVDDNMFWAALVWEF